MNAENPTLDKDISVADALSQMQNGMSETSTIPLSAANSSNGFVSYEEYSQKSMRLFSQISEFMGDFLDSLKPLDKSFAEKADVFFNNARAIAQKSEGRNLSEQEFDDIATNILSGLAVNGVGTLLSTVKTGETLRKVKSILRQDAEDEAKANGLKNILSNIDMILEYAGQQYEAAASRTPLDYDDLYRKFDNLRLSVYNAQMAYFLDATYKAALKYKFQDEYDFPNLFSVNQFMFDTVFELDEKRSSDSARIQYYREITDRAVENIKHSITSNATPTAAEVLLAKDSALMAVAIHNCNPIETIGYDNEDELTGVDKDLLTPECREHLVKFFEIYRMGDANATTSTLALSLSKNKSLAHLTHHLLHMYSVPDAYKKRVVCMNLNIYLTGILCFLICMSEGFTWYWSAVIGVIGLIVMTWLSPQKSTIRKFMKKLNYVERSIKVNMMQNGGYSETLDLKAIEISNTVNWVFGIIGGLMGLPFSIVGAIIGFFIGMGISKLLFGGKDDENESYDYTKVSTGRAWPGYVMITILSGAIILTIYGWVVN